MKNFATNLSAALVLTLTAMSGIVKMMFEDIAESLFGNDSDKRDTLNELKDAIANAPEMFFFLTEFTLNGIAGEIRDGKLSMDELRNSDRLAEVCEDRFRAVITAFVTDEAFRLIMGMTMFKRIDSLSEMGWFGLNTLEPIFELMTCPEPEE
jgi:hypothetical protein